MKLLTVGASGGIGQPLSLLLKLNEYVEVLSLYDVVGTPGVGADIGHIDSVAKASFEAVPIMGTLHMDCLHFYGLSTPALHHKTCAECILQECRGRAWP